MVSLGKKILIGLLAIFVILSGCGGGGGGGGDGGESASCSDGIDNAGDGKKDSSDPDCSNTSAVEDCTIEESDYASNDSYSTAIVVSLDCDLIKIKGHIPANSRDIDYYKLSGSVDSSKDLHIRKPRDLGFIWMNGTSEPRNYQMFLHLSDYRVRAPKTLNNNYLAIASDLAGNRGDSEEFEEFSGNYEITISKTSKTARPKQKVWIHFSDDFALEDIDGWFNQYEFNDLYWFEHNVYNEIKERFENYGYDSDEIEFFEERPTGTYSTLNITMNDSDSYLGLANHTDKWNDDYAKSAEVFGGAFADFGRLQPTPEEMRNAFANVAAHEISHLLGLTHVADPTDIMDTTGSLDKLLEQQTPGTSPIDSSIFRNGQQNANDIYYSLKTQDK